MVLIHIMLSIGDMCQNCIQLRAPPDDPYIYLVKVVFFLYVLIPPFFSLFLIFINFDIVHLFLPLDVRLTLVSLTMFV